MANRLRQREDEVATSALEGPFRCLPAERPHLPEAERAAAAELARRAARLHKLVTLACVLGGIAAGAACYSQVREIQISLMGGHFPAFSALIGIGMPFGACLSASQWISAALARLRHSAWLADVSARYGVPVEVLEDYTALL